MQTKTDASYGIIPLRKIGDDWEVFLIHQYSRIGKNSYWVFPKGHPEGEETPMQTAERELFEETGFRLKKLVTGERYDLSYSFLYDSDKIQKTVGYFLGEIAPGVPNLDSEEVKEGGWFTLKEARKKIDYQATRQLFVRVCDYLGNTKSSKGLG